MNWSNRGFVGMFNLGAKACRAEVRAAIAGTDAVLRQETVAVPACGSADLSWSLDLRHSLLAAEGAADLVFDATDGGNGDRLAMHLMRPVGIDVLLAHRPLRLDTPVREVQRWSANAAVGGAMTFAPIPEGGVRAVADFGASARDLWAYPQFFGLPPADAMRGVKGVVLRGRVDGGGTVRMFVAERNGAKYIHASPLFSADGQWHNIFVSFQDFAPFASIDPNGQLDPDQLDHIEIGCNTGARHCVIEVSQLWFVGGETP